MPAVWRILCAAYRTRFCSMPYTVCHMPFDFRGGGVMKRVRLMAGVWLAALSVAGVALAKDGAPKPKPGPLTGTWECTSHGGPQGDMQFTLYLEQEKEAVTGSVSSPIGDTEISSATYKHHAVEIHIDSPQGNY